VNKCRTEGPDAGDTIARLDLKVVKWRRAKRDTSREATSHSFPHSRVRLPVDRRTASPPAFSTANDHGDYAIAAVFPQ
jgi:hypothetical protein